MWSQIHKFTLPLITIRETCERLCCHFLPPLQITILPDFLLRYAFGGIAGSSAFRTLGKHISLSDDNRIPSTGSTDNAFGAFLLKSNKQGVPLWVAHIHNADVTALTPAGVQVDASTSPPSIYIAATIAYSVSPDFCNAAYVANSLTAPTCTVTIKNRPDASNPTVAHVKAFLAKYTGAGVALWASPLTSSDGVTITDLSISAFRPSTSGIINYQTQNDQPSAVPVKPYLKDNGGIFLAGTLTSVGTIVFGYESAIYSNNPSSGAGQVSQISVPVLSGFVAKYDHDGRVLWSRAFAGSENLDAIPSDSKVVDVSAMNDRVYVVGYTAGAIKFQSCEFRTHSGGTGDVLSENRECGAGAANFASLSGTTMGVFVVAYDASGVVQWIKNYASSTQSYSFTC